VRYSLPKSVTVAAAISCGLVTTAQAALTISNAKTKNVTCTGGVCTPTGSNANLNVGELQTMLASSDVTVKSSAGTPTLGVLDAVTWASTHRLTLDAYQFIHVRAPVVVEGVAGLTLITNDGGSGGDYIFESGGYANFWDHASSLVINGHSYTLVGDVKTLANDILTNPQGSYALAKSYDASADGSYTDVPIGSFVGTLEGLGNQIRNLTVRVRRRTGPSVGLFSTLYSPATVRDIALAKVDMSTAWGGFAGALAGYNESGTIIHASASGTVKSKGKYSSAGGLVGLNKGDIVDSSAAVTVYAAHAGGLVGTNYGEIDFCRAAGNVSSLHDAGGLVGNTLGTGRIFQSYAAGTSTATEESARAGGLVGYNDQGSIIQSYATGSVNGSIAGPEAGGLVGFNKARIEQTYSTGSVSVVYPPGGGVVGVDRNSLGISDAYWDFDTSGITDPFQGAGSPYGDPAGITGLTDAQLKSALPAGFDPNVWGQSASINNGWPYLLANPPQ